MGPTLQIASEKGAYTLTDTATFLANQSRSASRPSSRSGIVADQHLQRHRRQPGKWPKVNAAGAKAFEDFVTGAAGQQIIATFGTDTYELALFIADAGKDYASLK